MKPQVVGPPESIHRVVDDDLLEKLKLTFPEERPGGYNQLKRSCCNVKSLLECVGALLAFHLVSVVAAICGLVAVAVLLMGGAMIYVVVFMPPLLASRLPLRLAQLCCGVLVTSCVALVVASFFSVDAFTVFNILMLYVASGGVFYHHAVSIVFAMVWIDARLANYINEALSDDSAPEKGLQPEDCAKRFENDALDLPDEYPPLLPVIALMTRLWMVVLYYGVCKALVGGLSAVSIFCSVIQPAMSIFSGGHASIFFSSITIHSDPILYVLVVLLSCAVGGVCLVLVGVLSVKLTWRVFGETVAQQGPASPARNATTTSFTLLESTASM